MDSSLAIEASGLGKAYRRTWALRGVSLAVGPGEKVVLLGPNGAGKTTLMRLLATLAVPTRGSLRIVGLDPRGDARRVRSRIGVVAHGPYLYDDLTARENLEFYSRLYALRDPVSRYMPLMQAAGLSTVMDRPVRAYSRGMQQRLALVRSLLHDPELLLLDEPDTGLDQEAVRFLEGIVRSPGRDRTVVFSTHNLDLGVRLADRVVMLASGGVTHDAPAVSVDVEQLREAYSSLARAGG